METSVKIDSEEEPEINMNLTRKNLPTQEEMRNLRETKVSLHSDLFEMQINELLKEIKPDDRLLLKSDKYLKKVLALICPVKYPANIDVEYFENLQDLSRQVVTVINRLQRKRKRAKDKKLSNELATCVSTEVVGSHIFDGHLKNEIKIDLVVKLRKVLFNKEDLKRDIYVRKIKFYTLYLAHTLKVSKFFQRVGSKITIATRSCPDQIVLLVKSEGSAERACDIYVRLVPERYTFNLNKLRNLWQNVHTFFPVVLILDEDKKNKIVTHCTTLLGQDLVSLSNESLCSDLFKNSNMREAFLLFKLWMRKYELNEGYGCVGNFLVRMFMVYLFRTNCINNSMSAYKIIRNMWIAFGESEWTIKGISLAVAVGNVSKSKPSLEFLQSKYKVLFVDVSGFVNLAGLVEPMNYFQLKMQSLRALEVLKNPSITAFHSLFITPVDFLCQFDHIICFDDLKRLANALGQLTSINLEFCNNAVSQFIERVLPVIMKGVTDRVEHCVVRTFPRTLIWELTTPPINYEKILLGIKLHSQNSIRPYDALPLKNFSDLEDFRSFWGDKVTIRHFPDGTITESALWTKKQSLHKDLRSIVLKIIKYLLKEKLQIPKDMYVAFGNRMESILRNKSADLANIKYGTGEDATIAVITAFNKLSVILHELKDLELNISSIEGISPVFRYTDPAPPLPFYLTKKLRAKNVENPITRKLVSCIKPNNVIIKFIRSGKWSQDRDVIKRLKSALYVSLSEKLTSTHELKCVVNSNYIDVVKDGFVFRLEIYCPAEVSGIKKRVKSDGVVEYTNTKESLRLEKLFVELPLLTRYLHALHQEHHAYGPTSGMAKIWFSRLLIDYGHFPEICIDLLVAYLFIHPYPYEPVLHPQIMFLRFLKLMASTDWRAESIIINFDNILKDEELFKLRLQLTRRQRSKSVSLIIVTPFDKLGTLWTSDNPTPIVMGYMSESASKALSYLEGALNRPFRYLKMFRCTLNFDLVIHLQSNLNIYNSFRSKLPSKNFKVRDLRRVSELPKVDFNPVKIFLNELENSFSNACLFFHNNYGGNFVGILIKQHVHVSENVKVKKRSARLKKLPNKKQISINVDVLKNQIRIMGKGLIKSIAITRKGKLRLKSNV